MASGDEGLRDLISIRIDPNWPHHDLWTRQGYPIRQAYHYLENYESGIEESAGVNYATVDTVGRPESYQVWTGGSNRTVPLTFVFRVEDPGQFVPQVYDRAMWLEALKYPIGERGGPMFPPPTVYVSVGQLLFIRAIATEVGIRWPGPFDPETHHSHVAEVSATFTEVSRSPRNFIGVGGHRMSRPNATATYSGFPENGGLA